MGAETTTGFNMILPKNETCKICTDRGRKNAFTRGSSNFKTSSIESHQKSTDHQTAMIQAVFEKDMKNAEKKTANFLASEGIALIKIKIHYPVLKKNIAANIELLKLSEMQTKHDS